MEGHGEKYSRKQEQAIVALLNASTIAEAAKQAAIGETTIWRWLQNDEFQEQYRQARRKALDVAISRIQQITGEAVEVLRQVASDADSPASSRVSAAKAILELALKARETEELEERVKRLESLVPTRRR